MTGSCLRIRGKTPGLPTPISSCRPCGHRSDENIVGSSLTRFPETRGNLDSRFGQQSSPKREPVPHLLGEHKWFSCQGGERHLRMDFDETAINIRNRVGFENSRSE